MSFWQAFIFDFDGVLVDSVQVKTEAYRKMFSPFGEDIAERVVQHHLRHGGLSRFEKFRYYYREFLQQPLEESDVDRLAAEFSSLVVQAVVAAPEIPGATGFLEDFAGKVRFFINSGTPEGELKDILRRRGWETRFLEVRGSPQSKQKNLEMILKQHALTPSQCLFFGDSPSDYEAATAMKVPFLGFAENEDSPLIQAAPHIPRVRDFNEARDWLARFSSAF